MSSFLSGGICIFSEFGYRLQVITGFGFTFFSVIFFPIHSPFLSTVLWTTFLELDFEASSSAFIAICNYCVPYLLNRFLANGKNLYPSFEICSCSWFFRTTHYFYLLISNEKLTLTSIHNSLPFWFSKCYDNYIKLSVISFQKHEIAWIYIELISISFIMRKSKEYFRLLLIFIIF